MAGFLPPVPLGDIRNFPYTLQEWLRKINGILISGGIPWNFIDFTGSNITDIETRNHNDLQNIQGGTAGEYYHLTAAQHSDITGGDGFKTIEVAGQSDVVADTYQDTLTLVAAGDITITTDAGTKTITISATSADLGYYSVIGNGDLADPQIVFDGDGAPVVMWIPL